MLSCWVRTEQLQKGNAVNPGTDTLLLCNPKLMILAGKRSEAGRHEETLPGLPKEKSPVRFSVCYHRNRNTEMSNTCSAAEKLQKIS